ncbi:hypothetical protein KI387_000591 [Taxus chinensis]|uniref:Coatomer subunit zeta n=1 Tax=Taxus chinensis TaxID=29808 RepID=A0AA38GUF6_TAXCH|nr:hypothetical protein KI387_000591 [Taxus chinensis]
MENKSAGVLPNIVNIQDQYNFAAYFVMQESCPVVKNILLLDSEGKRVAVKYYTDDWETLASKLAFEKSIFTKTQRSNARAEAEIGMFDGYIVVYKFISDLHFFVTGGENENELILATVLQGFFDAVSTLLRNNVEKRTALENLDLILLCIDEMVDGGSLGRGGRLRNWETLNIVLFEINCSRAENWKYQTLGILNHRRQNCMQHPQRGEVRKTLDQGSVTVPARREEAQAGGRNP